MKQSLGLIELAKELEERKQHKIDVVANTKYINMTDDLQIEGLEEIGHDVLQPSKIAHNQIAQRLNIPAKYYNKMKEEAPELLAENVNHWFHKKPENRMIRTMYGGMRAFLSDRYHRIENEEIASAVLPVLLERQGVVIKSAAITDERMYIKAVFENMRKEVKVGDVVEAGVIISNSEVGLGAVNIMPLVHRLVCSNGMIVNDAKFSARHIGTKADEGIMNLLTDETKEASDRAIFMKIRDVVQASFDETKFNMFVDMMIEATEDKIEGDPIESIKILGKKKNILEHEQKGILKHLIEGADLSRYGLLNAVTRYSQDVESYDRATELEAIGGDILTLDRKEWKVISEAA